MLWALGAKFLICVLVVSLLTPVKIVLPIFTDAFDTRIVGSITLLNNTRAFTAKPTQAFGGR